MSHIRIGTDRDTDADRDADRDYRSEHPVYIGSASWASKIAV